MNNRPTGRKVTHGGSGSGAGRVGSGRGRGRVGGGSFFGGNSGSSGSSGSYGGSGSGGYNGSGGHGGYGGGFSRAARSKPGCLTIIAILVAMAFGGGRFAFGDFFGGYDYQEGMQYGGGNYSGWYTEDQSSGNTGQLNTEVSPDARDKFTTIKGDGTDKVTLMVYMCGTDLESRSAMGTKDLNEMISATIGNNMDVIVCTGGCKSWRNDVISNRNVQIYQIKNGNIKCLVENAGSASMTDPETLSAFIKWTAAKFPANRTSLIFWDHGGGSLAGYGYDELYPKSGSMPLGDINKALKSAGIKYDFIGFDACLMATAETALVLGNYADYLIGSEETEPGIGWYYTNWLTALSADTSTPTIEIGKIIADDFTAKCAKSCPGQSTTLSIVDLAELSQTLPEKLGAFAEDASSKIKNGEYQQVASARGSSKEFARSQGIDQVDLVHFATLLDTSASKKLAGTLTDAVKYNRTSGNTANAYGLSIYFPYKKLNKVDSMTNTYEQIGLDEDYTACIRQFAQMEACGQAVSGGTQSPFDVLTGQGGGSYQLDAQSMQQLIQALLGGNFANFKNLGIDGLTKSNTAFLSEDPLDAAAVTEYISDNRITSDDIEWQKNADGKEAIILTEDQWSTISTADMSMYYDDGYGYMEMGLDNIFDFDDDGNLLPITDRSWLSIEGQPVAYYHTETMDYEDGTSTITGYVPVEYNGTDARLILVFDAENEQGRIAGVTYDYDEDVTETAAKNLPGLKEGDKIKFLCDCYTYQGKYEDSYQLGKTLTIDDPEDITINNTDLGKGDVLITYKFTDIYGQEYWTPTITR